MKKRFSPTGWRKPRIASCLALAIFPCSALLASAALADITINGSVDSNVYGNGTGVNNALLLPLPITNANGYSVTVASGGMVTGGVFGGETLVGTSAFDVTANDNMVNISGGTVNLGVWGGDAATLSGTATATGNKVTSNFGTVNTFILCGDASSNDGDTTANKNIVSINGGTVDGGVIGGNAGSPVNGNATANENSVTLNGGTVGSDLIQGGSASAGTGAAVANGNTVDISGGTVGVSPLGIILNGGWATSLSGAATASENAISIDSGTIGASMLWGGFASTNSGASAVANKNIVTLTSGTVDEIAVGGWASANSGPGTATANENTVTIYGGTVGGVSYGGWVYSDSGAAMANGNTVTIRGGEVGSRMLDYEDDDVVMGGYAMTGSGTATASGNTVIISGGTVDGNVYGGHAQTNAISGAGLTANDNIVTISGNPVFGAASTLYGGFIRNGNGDEAPGATYSGNTLNIFQTSGLKVAGLANFQNLNFYIPTSLGNGGTMLTVTGTAKIDGATVNTGIAIDGGSSPLQTGDYVVLINAGTLIGTPANSTSKGEGMQGVSLLYDFAIKTEGNQLVATVAGADPNPGTGSGGTGSGGTGSGGTGSGGTGSGDTGSGSTGSGGTGSGGTGSGGTGSGSGSGTGSGVRVNPQTKALSEGFVAGPGLVNQTADFVADRGTAQAVETAGGGKPGAGKHGRMGQVGGMGFGGFGAISGGWNRYNTGSNVDMSSLSLMAGLAWGNDFAPGRLTLGAFFEYGNGWYDTYNSFANAADVHGEGDIDHLGGGVLARMDFSEAGPGMFYVEASVRAGGVSNDYKNSDLRDMNGLAASYDSSSAYYGAHAGLGYVFNLTEKTALDLYGKYFWTRQNGDSLRLSTGDSVRFDDVDSHRLRVGGRFVYAVNDLINPYAGLAYEHEFDGKARATTYGQAINAPSLQGGMGIGELGLAVKASKSMPLSVDLGVQGYVGVREGFTVSAQIRYDF